jgi:hypothetical protein
MSLKTLSCNGPVCQPFQSKCRRYFQAWLFQGCNIIGACRTRRQIEELGAIHHSVTRNGSKLSEKGHKLRFVLYDPHGQKEEH